MPKRASGNVKENGGTYEAFIPASWNHLKRRKTLGTFSSHEDAQNAIELFRTTYVKDSGVINSETFVAPNKLQRYTQESCRKSNGFFDCRDCGKEFRNVKKKGGIRCPECVSKFASSYTSTSSINNPSEERRQRIREAKRRYYQSERGKSKAKSKATLTRAVSLCPHGCQRYFAKSVRQRNKSFHEISSAMDAATYTSVSSANATRSPCVQSVIHVYRNAPRRSWYLFCCHKSSIQHRHKTIPSSEVAIATPRGGVQISSGWVTIAS